MKRVTAIFSQAALEPTKFFYRFPSLSSVVSSARVIGMLLYLANQNPLICIGVFRCRNSKRKMYRTVLVMSPASIEYGDFTLDGWKLHTFLRWMKSSIILPWDETAGFSLDVHKDFSYGFNLYNTSSLVHILLLSQRQKWA